MQDALGPDSPRRNDLRERLEELHEELRRVENVDETTRALLESLADDTRHLLEHEEPAGSERHRSLNDRLAEAAARFEGTHPDLAYVMAKVVDTLSGLGI